jgi:hypothetical protein
MIIPESYVVTACHGAHLLLPTQYASQRKRHEVWSFGWSSRHVLPTARVSNVVYNAARRRGFSIMHAYLLRYVSAAEVLRPGAPA